MAKPFDAATKYLIDLNPADWLRLAGVPVGTETVEALDADLSTVSAAADRLIRVTGSGRKQLRLYHVELQASYDADQDERVHWYQALARHEYRLSVQSIVFLLLPAAPQRGRPAHPGRDPRGRGRP